MLSSLGVYVCVCARVSEKPIFRMVGRKEQELFSQRYFQQFHFKASCINKFLSNEESIKKLKLYGLTFLFTLFFLLSCRSGGHYCLLFPANVTILTGTGEFKCESCEYLEFRFLSIKYLILRIQYKAGKHNLHSVKGLKGKRNKRTKV